MPSKGTKEHRMIQHTHAKPWVPSLSVECSSEAGRGQDSSRLGGLDGEGLFLHLGIPLFLQNLGVNLPSALSPSTGLGLGRTPPSIFPPQPRLQPALEHCEEASDHSLSVLLLSFKYLFKVQKGLDTLTLRQKQKNDSEYTSGDERDTEGKQETARR